MFPFPVFSVIGKLFFTLQLKEIFFSITKTYECCTLVRDLGHATPAGLMANTTPVTVQRADACLNKKEQTSVYLPQCCSIIYPQLLKKLLSIGVWKWNRIQIDRYTNITCCLLQNLVISNILYYTWKHERVNWLQNNGISLTQRYYWAHALACTVSTQCKHKIIHILFHKFTYTHIITLVQELWKCGVIMRNITLHVIHCILAYSAYQNENCGTHIYTTKPKFTIRTHS